MSYYPVGLKLKGKRCVVVGGGKVAIRKARRLVRYGAEVEIISPKLPEGIESVKWLKKGYERADLNGAFLAIAATDSKEVNKQVADDATASNILVNVVDSPYQSTFILPSLLERGDLNIAVFTSCKSPALAKKIRQDIETEFGLEYAEFLEILGQLRPRIQAEIKEASTREAIWQKLVNSDIPSFLRQGEKEKVEEILQQILSSPDLS